MRGQHKGISGHHACVTLIHLLGPYSSLIARLDAPPSILACTTRSLDVYVFSYHLYLQFSPKDIYLSSCFRWLASAWTLVPVNSPCLSPAFFFFFKLSHFPAPPPATQTTPQRCSWAWVPDASRARGLWYRARPALSMWFSQTAPLTKICKINAHNMYLLGCFYHHLGQRERMWALFTVIGDNEAHLLFSAFWKYSFPHTRLVQISFPGNKENE